MKSLLNLLFLVSCVTTTPPPPKVTALPEVVVSAQTAPQPLKVEAVIQTSKGLEKSTEKLFSVVGKLQQVLNSPKLEQLLLKAWVDGKAGFQDTSDTPEQVVTKLLKSGDWAVQYAFKRNFYRSVTAWTTPSDPVVYWNTRNFLGRADCPTVGSAAHEESHKRGYGHANAKRSLSVPYYFGTQVTLLCYEMEKAGEL